MGRLTWLGTTGPILPVDINTELRTHVTIRLGDRLVPCVYWQLSEPDFSLLEIGLEKETGLFRKLSVALYRGDFGRRSPRSPRQDQIGIPRFDVREWQPIPGSTAGDHQEMAGRIRLDEQSDGWWTIGLFDEPVVFEVSVPGLLTFGFSEQRELCELSVNMAASHSILGHTR